MDERLGLLRAMRAETNCWTWEYLHAGQHIAAALADGRLPADLIDTYPPGPDCPDDQSREIVHRVGMPYDDEPETRLPGGLANISADEVGTTIDALRAIAAGQASINDAGFSFYDDILNRHGLTVERAGQLMHELSGGTTVGAARLLHDSFAIPIDDAY